MYFTHIFILSTNLNFYERELYSIQFLYFQRMRLVFYLSIKQNIIIIIIKYLSTFLVLQTTGLNGKHDGIRIIRWFNHLYIKWKSHFVDIQKQHCWAAASYFYFILVCIFIHFHVNLLTHCLSTQWMKKSYVKTVLLKIRSVRQPHCNVTAWLIFAIKPILESYNFFLLELIKRKLQNRTPISTQSFN